MMPASGIAPGHPPGRTRTNLATGLRSHVVRVLTAMSLRGKLLGAFAAVLVPVLGVLVAGFRGQLAEEQAALLDHQRITAEAFAQRLEESFNAAMGIGWAVANDPLTGHLSPAELDPHLTALLQRYPAFVAIRVYDAEGHDRGHADQGPGREVRIGVEDEPWFRSTMATNSSILSEVVVLPPAGTVGIVASVPVRGPDGRAIGVVTVVTGAAQLAKRFEETRLFPGQSVFATDRTGRLAFHTALRQLSFDETTAYASFGPVRDALAGIPQVVAEFQSPLTHDERLGAFVPTSRYRWVVGVTMSHEVAFRPLHAGIRRAVFAFVVLLLGSAALALGLAQFLVGPVQRLEEAARALGAGELSRRVRIATGDELERLGHSFNAMAAQIEQREADVQRHRARAEAQASQLAAVIASMGEGVLIADADGRIVVANPAARRLAGIREEEDLGRTLDEHLARFPAHAPDGRPLGKADHPLGRALAGETFSGFEIQLQAGAGARLVIASGAPVRDAAGRIVLGVVVLHDVTAARRRERENEALSQIARALVRELGLERMATVVVQQSLDVLGVDMVALWVAELSRRELRLVASRHYPAEVMARMARVSFDAPYLVARAAQSGEIQVVEDFPASNRAPESKRLAEMAGVHSGLAIPLRSRGKLVGVVFHGSRTLRTFSGRDLEFNTTVADLFAVAIENAHLFNEVQKALSLREEWMAAAAHELRTPLTVIRGWSNWLGKREGRSPQENEALAAIHRQAERIAHLTTNLVEMIRLQSGVLRLQLESCELQRLVEEQVSAARARDDRHELRLQEAGPFPLQADRALLGRAVAHLLETAERYGLPGTAIEVVVSREGREAVVSVSYEGPVIPPERQPFVFEPFYEPVPSGAPGYVGVVSLALFLARRAVEAHGGHIWVTSTPSGTTTFAFTVPLEEASVGGEAHVS